MIARAFTAAGVDYIQWWAVSRALVRSDFHVPGAQTATSYSLRTIGSLSAMTVVYGLFGITAALVVVFVQDVLLAAVFALSYLTSLVATSMLTQHAQTLVATTDYAILAPRPVSSRTFLAIRITNIVFHVGVLTTMMGYPVIAAFTVAHGVSAVRGLAAAVALYACALSVALAIVTVYGSLMRWISPARLQRTLGYAQIVIGVGAYGGLMWIMDGIGGSALGTMTLPRGPWLLLLPPAWYASYIEIAAGVADGGSFLRAGVSLIVGGLLIVAIRGRVSGDYAARLGDVPEAAANEITRPSRAPAWLFTSHEARAVAILVRAHYRHDIRVRLGVLSMVPMVLFFVVISLRSGTTGDPFVARPGGFGGDMMAFAVLLFPTVLIQQLTMSDSYKACWLFFVTPGSLGRVVVALKNVIVVFFLLPFLTFVTAVMVWRFGHVGHALLHAALIGAVAHLALQSAGIVRPQLPFSFSQQKANSNWAVVAWMFVVVVSGNFVLFAMQQWIYRDWSRVAIFAVLLIVATVLLEWALRARARSARLTAPL